MMRIGQHLPAIVTLFDHDRIFVVRWNVSISLVVRIGDASPSALIGVDGHLARKLNEIANYYQG
jgi:hypothetical protein